MGSIAEARRRRVWREDAFQHDAFGMHGARPRVFAEHSVQRIDQLLGRCIRRLRRFLRDREPRAEENDGCGNCRALPELPNRLHANLPIFLWMVGAMVSYTTIITILIVVI